MLSKSYGVYSPEYVAPFCSGRYAPGEKSLLVLNDKYNIKTNGTEDYKFKIKNIHEDNLFKQEDDMYANDHQILQFVRVISKLTLEQTQAKKWKQLKDQNDRQTVSGVYEPKYLTEQHFSFIKRFYDEVYAEKPFTIKQMNKIIAKQPVELIETFIGRLKTHHDELKEEKQIKIAEWK